MRIRVVVLVGVMAAGLAWALAPPAPGPAVPGTVLMDIAGGKLPPDTGTDQTQVDLVPKAGEIDGAWLRVRFAPGDSFGTRDGGGRDWSVHPALRFDAVNPGGTDAALELVISHARTTNHRTRVVIPIVLKPGKNEVRTALAGWRNADGTAPDLGRVRRWYVADASGTGPTLYFGTIWLESSIAAGDPARLTRIRATAMPAITRPVSFDTPEADTILAALEVFPPESPWNVVIEDWPLHPNSWQIVAAIGVDKPLRYNPDMGFVLVPPNQPRVEVRVSGYAEESDRGPFAIPAEIPVEGWPWNYRDKKVTLADVQRNTLKEEGDRHAIVVDPVNRMLYEFFQFRKTDRGWEAAQASVFDLKSNTLRPDGWTSADAAGLPIFPAVVRYDELKRGAVEHAMRVTITRTRRAYVHPATHFASRLTDETLPRMGERFRLRKGFDVSKCSPEVRAILTGLKRCDYAIA